MEDLATGSFTFTYLDAIQGVFSYCLTVTSASVHLLIRDRPDVPAPRSRRNSRGAAPGSRSTPLSRQGSTTGSRSLSSHQASALDNLQASTSRPTRYSVSDEKWVDAIFSAHSDGLVVIIRHAH